MGAYFTFGGEFTTRTKVTKRGVLDGLESCFGRLWEKVEPFVSVARCGKRQKVMLEMDYVRVNHSEPDDIMRAWLKACELLMDDKSLMEANARYSGDEGDQEYTIRAGRRYLVLNNRIDALTIKIAKLTEERNKLTQERAEKPAHEFVGSIVEDESEEEWNG